MEKFQLPFCFGIIIDNVAPYGANCGVLITDFFNTKSCIFIYFILYISCLHYSRIRVIKSQMN